MLSVKLLDLIYQRIDTLGQEALTAHCELEQWRPTPFTVTERAVLSTRLQFALSEQRSWLDEIQLANEETSNGRS